MLSSDMTRDAIIGDFIFSMTIHAPGHRHGDPRLRRRFLALRDIPMTGLTRYLSQYDMTPMGIENMVRLSVDLFPGNLLSLLLKLPDLLFFRAFCDGFFVTLQTDCYIGQSGKGLHLVVHVTRVTFHSLLQMFLVIEGNGLPGSRTEAEGNQEKEKCYPDYQPDDEEFHLLDS